jgi:hypothetical protein
MILTLILNMVKYDVMYHLVEMYVVYESCHAPNRIWLGKDVIHVSLIICVIYVDDCMLINVYSWLYNATVILHLLVYTII